MPYSIEANLTSSPDPLNGSPTFSSPVKPSVARVRRSLPLQGSSPRKQTFQLDVGDSLSPQKIRVTVEADPSNTTRHNSYASERSPSPTPFQAPAVCRNIRTTTTTVPVKGLSDTEDDTMDSPDLTPKRGRGRPRKSVGTPVPTKSQTRQTTPGAKPQMNRRRTLGHLVDGDDSEDWDFAIGAGVEVGRGKGRSRSRSAKSGARNKLTPASKQTASPDKTVSSAATRNGRARRKTLTPEEIVIHEDNSDPAPESMSMHNNTESGSSGVLSQRSINCVPINSAFSTIRSTTTVGENDDPDVLLAKFTPAKKTPTKAGWSSPKHVPVLSANSLSTVSKVGEQLPNNSTPVSPGLSDEGNQKSRTQSNRSEDGCGVENKDEDSLGELPEFDTILESEGFSMISVDSVPSLREHLTSPYGPETVEERSEQHPLPANSILHLKGAEGGPIEDSFSSIAPEILEAATPGRRLPNRRLILVQPGAKTDDEDSFSSIPPTILQAATPGKPHAGSKLLVLEALGRGDNNDSFSTVLSAVLEDATPVKNLHTQMNLSNTGSEATEASKSKMEYPRVPSLSHQEVRERNQTSSRLLTPDDTPSPPDSSVQQSTQVDQDMKADVVKQWPAASQLNNESSILYPQMRSSPPSAVPRRYTYTAHLRQQKLLQPNLMATPSIVFSSPSLPPLIQPLPPNRSQQTSEVDSNKTSQLSLSPIVRAGRVLQDIALPSQSRSRTQSLGSPFKSPTVQRKSGDSPVHNPGSLTTEIPVSGHSDGRNGLGGDIFLGFSDGTKRELQKSLRSGEELAGAPTICPESSQQRNSVQQDDPFSNGARNSRTVSYDEKQYSLALPSHKLSRYPTLELNERQDTDTIRSEGAMSWQAETTVQIHTSEPDNMALRNLATACINKTSSTHKVEDNLSTVAESLQRRREVEWALERAAVSAQVESACTSQVIIISSDDDEGSTRLQSEIDRGEEDIWQAEARHSSSALEEQACNDPPKQDPVEKPRRSKIPSPWRKNSKRLLYSDELAQLSPQPRSKQQELLPPSMPAKPEAGCDMIVQRRQVSLPDPAEEDDFPDSSVVWHIPQKSNFAPKPRSSGNLDLSALLASSPLKMPSVNSHELTRPKVSLFATTKNDISSHAVTESFSCPSKLTMESIDLSPSQNETEDNAIGDLTSNESFGSETSSDSNAIQYPLLPQTALLSPTKSCLRTPSSTTPTKSVAFLSPTPSPTTLSSTIWSRDHWKVLHSFYNEVKFLPHPLADDDDDNLGYESDEEPSAYLGRTINARGEHLTLEKWHLDIVKKFRTDVPGWDEGVIAKRLFAIIVGEKLRQEGKM